MNGWVRSVWRELRHGTCLLAFAGMAVLVGVLLWAKGPDWGTRWNQLGFSVRDYMILLGPIGIVLGVWQGGRARRAEVGELLASTRRAALARHSSEIAALGLAAYAGVLLGVASAAWSIVVVGGYGTWVAPAYLIGLFPTLLGYVALGFGIGRLVPWRVAAPIAGVLGYLVLGLVTSSYDRLTRVTGGGLLEGVRGYRFHTGDWWWSLTIGLAATIAFIGLWSVERRPARSLAWLVPGVAGAAVLVVGIPLAVAASPGTDELVASTYVGEPLTCTTDAGPRVCVLTEDRHLLKPVTSRARAVLARLAGIDGAPRWAGPTPVGRTGSDGWPLLVDTGDTTPWGKPDRRWGDGISFSTYSVFSPDNYCTYPKGTGTLPGDPDGFAFAGAQLLSDWVEGLDDWTVTPSDTTDPVAPIIRRFAASNDAQRRAYGTLLVRAAKACNPAAARAAVSALAPA